MSFSDRSQLSERALLMVNGEFDVASLDYTYPEDAADFDAALAVAPRMVLSQLTLDNPMAQDFLYNFVKADSSNILKLEPSQLFPELLELYFEDRMIATAPEADGAFTFSKSVDGYFTLAYDYATADMEDIRYLDEALRMPVHLHSEFKAQVKVFDMLKYLVSSGISLENLTYDTVAAYLRSSLLTAYRNVLMVAVDKKHANYYSLQRYYRAIGDTVASVFERNFENGGALVVEFVIQNISPIGDAVARMEEEICRFRISEQQYEHEIRCEQMSLDNYERKAEIHAQYPDFPVSMTELEKDYALERYLRKLRVTAQIQAELLDEEVAEDFDTEDLTDDLTEDFLPDEAIASEQEVPENAGEDKGASAFTVLHKD